MVKKVERAAKVAVKVSKMKYRTIKEKLTSRKLWVSVGSFVSMIIVATGGTENQAAQVAALIMAGATVLGYLIGEGLVDAANKPAEGIECEAEFVDEE